MKKTKSNKRKSLKNLRKNTLNTKRTHKGKSLRNYRGGMLDVRKFEARVPSAFRESCRLSKLKNEQCLSLFCKTKCKEACDMSRKKTKIDPKCPEPDGLKDFDYCNSKCMNL